MDINSLFNKIVNNLDLGNITEGPIQVTGGLTHRMFRIFKAEKYEELFKENNIKAVYSLEFNNKKMQEIDGQYFYVYEWYDGKSLKNEEITEYHCRQMGKTLAEIHNIDLGKSDYSENEKNIDFKYYINLAKEKESSIYELIYDKLDILNDSLKKGNNSIKNLPNFYSLCHNDMDPKNVMWLDNDYKLIDLECLGYYNPYLELYELALCWSGYEKCNINFDLFKVFFESYFDNSSLDKNIDWEGIYYANNRRLEWLEFNIRRSLMIDCNTKEEQKIGINEVKETIEHVIYYDKAKDEILKNISDLI